MKQLLFAVTLTAIVIFSACSEKTIPSKTVMENPLPAPPPVVKSTFQGTLLPMIQAKCSPCHTPSKNGNKANFENFDNVVRNTNPILIRIQKNPGDRGFMPQRNSKLTNDELAVFMKWVNDGSLEK